MKHNNDQAQLKLLQFFDKMEDLLKEFQGVHLEGDEETGDAIAWMQDDQGKHHMVYLPSKQGFSGTIL